MALLGQAHGTALQRQMIPFIQYALVCGLKTLVGNASTNALPNRLFSAEALMQLVAFNTRQIRQGLR